MGRQPPREDFLFGVISISGGSCLRTCIPAPVCAVEKNSRLLLAGAILNVDVDDPVNSLQASKDYVKGGQFKGKDTQLPSSKSFRTR